MKWSPQQERALRDGRRFVESVIVSDDPMARVFQIDGYAGTGKSTIAKSLVDDADGEWLYAAYTGKSALVMRQKGCRGARTIHSLIYRPNGEKRDARVVDVEMRLAIANDELEKAKAKAVAEEPSDAEKSWDGDGVNFIKAGRLHKYERQFATEKGRVDVLIAELERAKRDERRQPAYQLWEESPLKHAPGLVIDEYSMLDEDLARDVLSFGKKLILLGDPDQLPPVGAPGYFSRRKPDHLLTEVHRHARESGILDLATYIREGGDVFERARVRWERPDCQVRMRGDTPDLAAQVTEADQVIVGLNRTRHAFNKRQRELLGRTDPWPVRGDKVICLRNDREMGLLNGSMWYVRKATRCAEDQTIGMEIVPDDWTEEQRETREPTVLSCWEHHFVGREDALKEMGWNRRNEQEFDMAYAITCHKAQGSQWPYCVVFDESRGFKGVEMQRRWMYTAVTRAAQKLVVVV